jgi:uncharacterized membrane protein
VVESIEHVDAVPPAFPKRTGVSDTFSYIAHFLPVAAIAFVVELVFPIVLFAYTFWELAWAKYRDQHRVRQADAGAGAGAGAERSIDDHPDPINPMPNGAMPPEPRRRGRGGLGPRGHRFES